MQIDLEALGLLVKRAQWRNHRTMDAALRETGVSLVQWDALRAIDRSPGASAHDLASSTFQSDQAFGTLASRLVDRGLVTRSAGRGRRVEHLLTDAGRDALDRGYAVVGTVLDELFAPLDDADRATLGDLLARLTA
jgi:DNA-binding MarR family transcriptional regulator